MPSACALGSFQHHHCEQRIATHGLAAFGHLHARRRWTRLHRSQRLLLSAEHDWRSERRQEGVQLVVRHQRVRCDPSQQRYPGQRTSRRHPCTCVSGEWPALRFALKNFCGLSDNPEGARRRPKPTGLDENLPSLAANADAMAEESNTRNAEGSKHFRPEPMTVLSRPPKNGPRSPQPAFRRFHPLGKRAASFSAVQTAHLFMSPSVSTT